MKELILYEDLPLDATSPLDLDCDGDSLLGLSEIPLAAEFNGENLYGIMPKSKWGWPWDKNYNSNYVVKISFMGKTLYWHKWAVVPLMKVQQQLFDEGWNKKYYWEDLQTWNKRMIAGTNTPSNHSWPTAIDINPRYNPMRYDNKLVTDIPYRIVEIFKRYGFKWGGEYRTVKDAMHFEYLGEPVKDYVGRRVLSLKDPYMNGEDVKEAQTLLAYYGYDISADGVFGPYTDACTKSFQGSKILLADGIIGANTWTELLAKKSDRILKMGMRGKDVEWIQKALNKTINVQIKVDGMFGNDTNTAIKLFQKKNYLSVDGVIGAKTWQVIRNRISQTYR